VVLAADDSEIPDRAMEGRGEQQIQQCWCSLQSGQSIQEQPPFAQQTIIIVGWNEMLGAMIVELDRGVGPGSTLVIHSPVSVAEREHFFEVAQKRRNHQCKNLTFKHTLGSLGARFMLEELPFEMASAIIVLADSKVLKAEDSSAADAQTLAACVQIQDILLIRGSSRSIMPQLLEADSEELALQSGIRDYILTDQLAARITACVTEVPQLSSIIDCIVKDRSCSFYIRKLSDYPLVGSLDLHSGITFDEVTVLVAGASEIALGWSSQDSSEPGAWEMNPKDRMKRRTCPQDMQVVVLHKHNKPATLVSQDGSNSNGDRHS